MATLLLHDLLCWKYFVVLTVGDDFVQSRYHGSAWVPN